MSARTDTVGPHGFAAAARIDGRPRAESVVEDPSPACRADERPARRRELESAGIHGTLEAGAVCTTRCRTEADSEKHQSKFQNTSRC